jgi:dihydrofolate reductase
MANSQQPAASSPQPAASSQPPAASSRSRKIIVRLATSADGYIARPDGGLDWLTSRPKPKGFYGISEFVRSIDTHVLGRKTYDEGLRLGGTFDSKDRTVVFSRRSAPPDAPVGVEFTSEAIRPFVERLRAKPGKNIWLMGGGGIIASFLDARAIDEFVITVMPVFICEGIPLIAASHRLTALELLSVERFDDGVVQSHYRVLGAG